MSTNESNLRCSQLMQLVEKVAWRPRVGRVAMKRFRAAFAMLALCLLTAIDPRPSFAETYRPWCVQYPTSDATSCAFHLIRTMHDDGGPRNRRRLRAEPMYGTASTASAPGVRVAARRR